MMHRTQYIEALSNNDSQAGEEVAAAGGTLQVQVQRPPDSLSSLLALLAALCDVYPALGTDDALRWGAAAGSPESACSMVMGHVMGPSRL